MTESPESRPAYLAPDEKITQVMAYTMNSLVRGGVVTKENIRVSLWLRTAGAPEYIHLHNANVLTFGLSLQSQSFSEYLVPTAQLLAFHLVPPASDPPDFDETEANRKMEPVSALVGTFRFNGHIRMATQIDLATFLAITRMPPVAAPSLSFYDVEISNPNLQAMGVLRVPFVILRSSLIAFATRT